MSDKVEINLEKMIPELEEYKNRGVFTNEELKQIINTRKKHEYRLQRFDKKLIDIIRYIESEIKLERIRDKRIRRNKLPTSYYDKSISNKIVSLYKEALYRFNDKNLIVNFCEYAIKKKLYGEMKEVFASYCLKHTSDTDLWIYCACKLFEVGDIDSSRATFLKGIRLNPNNMNIRVEFFRMEVMHMIDINKMDPNELIEESDILIPYNIYLDTRDLENSEEALNEMREIAKEVKDLHSKIMEVQ